MEVAVMKIDIQKIPPELREVPHWVVWKAGPVKPDGKFDKVPVHPETGRNLKGDLLPQCMGFSEAVAAYETDRFSGIGFCHRDSPFVFGDLDGVVEDGRIADWAREDIEKLGTYCEISPSGRGLRWVALGKKPGTETNNKAMGCELYDGDTRHPFVTITGNAVSGFERVRDDIQPEVSAWYWKRIAKSRTAAATPAPKEGPGNSLTPEEVQARLLSNQKMQKVWNGDTDDYASRSEAEMALLDALAELTAGDLEKMREVYSESEFAKITYADKAERTFEGTARKAILGMQDRFLRDPGSAFCGSCTPDGYSAEELFTMVIPETRWAIKDLLPAGLGILAGRPKLGKSWMALQMCITVAQGGDFLGFSCEGGEAVYLALEDGKKRLQSRMKTLLQGARPPRGLTFYNEWRPLDHGGLEDLDALLASRPDLLLLVIDTWQKVRPIAKPRGASAYEVDYAEAGKLKSLADRHGCSLLLIHHLRKSDPSATGGDILEKVNGSTGITGAADSILILDRCRNTADAELHVTGRDIQEGVHALVKDTNSQRWSYSGDGSVLARTPEQQKVLDAIKQLIEASPKDVAEFTGLDHQYCKKTVGNLIKQGLIRRTKYGHYSTNDPYADL